MSSLDLRPGPFPEGRRAHARPNLARLWPAAGSQIPALGAIFARPTLSWAFASGGTPSSVADGAFSSENFAHRLVRAGYPFPAQGEGSKPCDRRDSRGWFSPEAAPSHLRPELSSHPSRAAGIIRMVDSLASLPMKSSWRSKAAFPSDGPRPRRRFGFVLGISVSPRLARRRSGSQPNPLTLSMKCGSHREPVRCGPPA